MIFLKDCDFSNQTALVRVDFNVPIDEASKTIQDTTRIDAAIPTLAYILKAGGKVIIMSHMGRPKGQFEARYSLDILQVYLAAALDCAVYFASDCIGEEAYQLSFNLKAGEVLLLENLRFHKGETKGDPEFAQALSRHADIYVNDAFGTVHRAHASTTIIAQFMKQKVCGLLLEAELKNIDKILNKATAPFTAIIGGAKISDKILVLKALLDKVDNLIIGGAMAYTFFKAQGGEVGNSLVEVDKTDLALEILRSAEAKNVKVILPPDSLVQELDRDNYEMESNMKIKSGWMGIDLGEQGRQSFTEVILESKTILWNGPMGIFERPEAAKGTLAIAEAVAKRTAADPNVFSLIGGGDTISAIKQTGLADSISYISTGGGALLEFLEGKTLPGVAALQ